MTVASSGQHRLFFALDFDEGFKYQLFQWIQFLDINGRRVDPSNIHLTLQFLGTVKHHQIIDVIESMDIPQLLPFSLSIGNAGFFAKNEVLYCQIDQGLESVKKVASYVQQQTLGLSFIRREKRRYQPHVTIARDVKPPTDFAAPPPSLQTEIKHFSLMESRIIKSGVYYETLDRWPLYRPSDKELLLGRLNDRN